MKKNIIVSVLIAFLVFLAVIFPCVTPADAKAESVTGIAVIERDSGRLLYSSDANKRMPMASTTKIATCITVIEHCDDLDRVITVPDSAVGVEGSSVYLKRGEKISIRDLLYGLMLRSGNDCATALALTVSDSVADFARLMNDIATKAGATDTNFVNPHGLHCEGHYTTAYDLAKISAYAMKNEVFRKIVSTKSIRISEGEENFRVLLNKNKMLTLFEGADGIKTGFTKRAGRCLVSSATRNGMNVICVVLNCPDMFERSQTLLSRAFDEYEKIDILQMGTVSMATVNNGKSENTDLAVMKSFSYPLKKEEKERIKIVIEGVENMVAPVKKETKNGKIQVFLDKQLIFSDNLYTIYNVESKTFWDKLKDLLQN